MNDWLLKLYVVSHDLKNGEDGQDLVEYALLSAVIVMAATTGVSHVAAAVTKVFSNVSTSLA